MIKDLSILRAALTGYQAERDRIDAAMAAIRLRFGQKADGPSLAPARPKRKLSVAARKRIAAAQKKRWAAYRKAH